MNTTEFPRYVYLYNGKLQEVAPPLGIHAIRVKLTSAHQMEIPSEWLMNDLIETPATPPEKL